MTPANAVAAAIHPDPYAYYAGLASEAGLHFDPQLRMWIATSAASVKAVLSNPDCAVRPPAEHLPKAIVNSPAGEVFRHLMRMNDGENHARPKLAVQRAFAALDMRAISQQALIELRALARSKDLRRADHLTRWTHESSVYVLGRMLGFSAPQLPLLADWMEEFVACLSPLSSEQQIAGAGHAACALMEQFRALLQGGTRVGDGLAALVAAQADLLGWTNARSLVSNLIGLLSQAYEGTAGLIGNTMIALARQPQLQASLRLSPECIQSAVEEVSRLDPSVQNTRRFVTTPTRIGAVGLEPGDVVLLLLAAANRDPRLNEHPDQFRAARADRRTLGFGHGPHACPGQQLACAIAASATTIALELLSPAEIGALRWRYRPSVNGRIPVFFDPSTTREQA